MEGLHARLQLIYGEVNAAWSRADLARGPPLRVGRPLRLPPVLGHRLRTQGLRNVLEGMRIVEWKTVKIVRDRHYDALTVRVWGTGPGRHRPPGDGGRRLAAIPAAGPRLLRILDADPRRRRQGRAAGRQELPQLRRAARRQHGRPVRALRRQDHQRRVRLGAVEDRAGRLLHRVAPSPLRALAVVVLLDPGGAPLAVVAVGVPSQPRTGLYSGADLRLVAAGPFRIVRLAQAAGQLAATAPTRDHPLAAAPDHHLDWRSRPWRRRSGRRTGYTSPCSSPPC